MFNLKSKLMLAAAVLFVGGVSAANAQISNGSVVKVNVPDSFVVKDTKLPAGDYTIERTPSTADSPSLLIMRGEGEAIVFDTVLSNSRTVAGETELVFDSIHGVNYLSAIVVKGSTGRNEISKTKAQIREMQKDVAIRNVVPIADAGL